PGVSRANARHLLMELGLPQQIFASSPGSLMRHLPSELATRLAGPASPEVRASIDAAREVLARDGHQPIPLADPAYPKSLFDSGDPPLLLYLRGNASLLERESVSIVGARSATEGGKDNARAFARHLASRGWTIVSGMARGIDAAAHEGALQAGGEGGGT